MEIFAGFLVGIVIGRDWLLFSVFQKDFERYPTLMTIFTIILGVVAFSL